ncbi:MAG: hypothetical protein QW051_03460, partial [Candidatus Aenigmatarchaeota archaeon]
IGAGIVFIALALIVVIGFALGPYLEVVSPRDGKLLIIASTVSLAVMIGAAAVMVYETIRCKK